MRSLSRICLLFSVALIATTFAGCNSEKTESVKSESTPTVSTDTLQETEAASADFFSRIPTATEIPAMLQRIDAVYNPKLPNKSGKAGNYTTNATKAALNLGIYGADVAYLCAYDKNKDAQGYVKDIQELAKHLNANDAFGGAMLDRLKKNMENNDSLMAIMDEGLKVANTILQQSDRKADAFMAGTGGFVEGLYLALGVVESFPKDMKPADRDLILVPITRTIVDQKKSLADLVLIGKDLPASPEVDPVNKDLNELLGIYENLNLEEHLKANQGDQIIGDANLKKISEKVKEVRSRYIQ